jgi:hypothetical protein
MEEGWDKLNVERTIQLAQGNLKLKPLPAEAPGVPKPAKKAPLKPAAAKPVVKKKPAAKRKSVVKVKPVTRKKAPVKRGVKRR